MFVHKAVAAFGLTIATIICPITERAMAGPDNDTITIAAPWAIGALTPAASGTVLQRVGLTEPLTQPDDDGKIVGLLAESWIADEALTTWRFRIRPNVVFHDGSALTADAVAANLNKFKAESALRRVPVVTIASDGDEVVFTLSRSFAPLPAYLSHWSTGILSPSSLAALDTTKVIGTGYYRLVAQDGTTSISLTAFSDYWGEKPSIKNVHYVHARDAGTRLAMVRAGEAELAFGLNASAAREVKGNLMLRTEATPRVRSLKLNVGIEPFSDLRVRQAISLAIDRQGIASALLSNPSTAATQLLPPVVKSWHRPHLPPFAYDPARARTLLDEAGWTVGESGIRHKDGKPFKVEFLSYNARPELPEIVTAVQSQLAEIGIDATIANVDWTAIPLRHNDKTLEMAITSDGFAYVPEPIGALAENYTKGGAPWGTLDWRNAEFDTLVEDYQSTLEPAKQEQLRGRMMEILHAELPIVTITWYDETFAVSGGITGFEFDAYEMRYGLNKVRWSN